MNTHAYVPCDLQDRALAVAWDRGQDRVTQDPEGHREGTGVTGLW